MNHYNLPTTALPSAAAEDDAATRKDKDDFLVFRKTELYDLEEQLAGIMFFSRPSTPTTEASSSGPMSSSSRSEAGGESTSGGGGGEQAPTVLSTNSTHSMEWGDMDPDEDIKRQEKALAQASRMHGASTGVPSMEWGDMDPDEVVKRQAKALARAGTKKMRPVRAKKPSLKPSPSGGGVGGLGGQQGGMSGDHLLGDMQREGLAVATLVIEEEGTDDGSVQQAEAIDPSKGKNRLSKRYLGGLVFLSLLILGGVVACVLGLAVLPSLRDNDKDNAMSMEGAEAGTNYTAAPTTYRESLGIEEHLAMVVGSSKLTNQTTPAYKALQWLLHDDPLQLPKSAPNLIQRYSLALFYFTTTTRGPWRSCNPPIVGTDETHQCDFQMIKWVWPELVFDSVPENRWLSRTNECDWAGVVCEGDVVKEITLVANEMSGNLPAELSLLPNLDYLTLAYNDFTGTLPVSLAVDWQHQVHHIQLHSCNFSGTIPKEWFQFKNVVRLNLAENFFTGTLPTEIGELGSGHTGMEDSTLGLFLYDNPGLTGTIPSEIGNLEGLAFIRISKTSLTGQLPSEIGKLAMLQEFWAHKTEISGTIPSEFGRLSSLSYLRMQDTGIGGTIPEEIYDIPHLERLEMWQTNLQGTISPKIGQLADTLTVLRLQNNTLTGELPSELGLLTNIMTLYLQHNELEGSIPQPMCDIVLGRTNVTGSDDDFREIEADCIISNHTDASFVSCELGCCTVCCDSASQTCVGMWG